MPRARPLQGLYLLAVLSGACAQVGTWPPASSGPVTLSTFVTAGGSTPSGPATLLPRLSTFFPPGTFFGNGTVALGQMLFRRVPARELTHGTICKTHLCARVG